MKKLYLSLILLVITLSFVGFIFWRYYYLATITIEPNPTDAVITVNGQSIADRTFRLPRGDYQIEISKPGYRTQALLVKAGLGTQVNKSVALEALPQPTSLLKGAIRSVAMSPDKKAIFFEQNNTLYTYSLVAPAATPAIPITPQLSDIKSVDWSPDFQLALIHKNSGETGLYDFKRYNLLHQEYQVLAAGNQQAVWASDGNSFIYENKGSDGEHSLIRANRAGGEISRLAGLAGFPVTNLELTGGSGTNLYLSNKDVQSAGDIFLFDSHQRTVTPLTDSTRAYGPVTSADGSKLLYQDNGELVVADADGKNKRNLNIRARVGNYQFIDNKTVAVLTANTVTTITIENAAQKSYEVYAPDDAVDNFSVDTTGKTIFYSYKDTFYQLPFNQ